MRYETAKAFRTALEQRLKTEAQATGVAQLRLRKRVAFERFLARLATSESSGWALKGAFALELRLDQNAVPGLLEFIGQQLGEPVSGPDLFAYVAAVTGGPGYVTRFEEDLQLPGLRIPVTADLAVFSRAVQLGSKVLCCTPTETGLSTTRPAARQGPFAPPSRCARRSMWRSQTPRRRCRRRSNATPRRMS